MATFLFGCHLTQVVHLLQSVFCFFGEYAHHATPMKAKKATTVAILCKTPQFISVGLAWQYQAVANKPPVRQALLLLVPGQVPPRYQTQYKASQNGL